MAATTEPAAPAATPNTTTASDELLTLDTGPGLDGGVLADVHE